MSVAELQNARCVSELMSQLSFELRPQHVLDLSSGKITPRFILALLRFHGLSARLVHPSARDFARLEAPTLLVLDSGDVRVLEGVRAGVAQLRDGAGDPSAWPLPTLSRRVRAAIDRSPGTGGRGPFVQHLLALLLHDPRTLVALLFTCSALAGVGLVLPWLTRIAVGRAVQDAAPRLLLALAAAMAVAACVQAWLRWLAARTRIGIDIQIVHAISDGFVRRLLRLPYTEHVRRGLGPLLRSVGAAEEGARLLTALGVAPAFDALAAVVYLIAISAAAPALGALFAVLAACSALGMLLLSRRAARLHAEELAASAAAQARLHELLLAVPALKAARAEGQGLLRWLEPLLAERGVGLGRELTEAWQGLWLATVQRAGALAVLLGTASEVLAGSSSLAELVYLGMLSAAFLQASTNLCQVLAPIWALRTYAASVDEVLAIDPRAEAPIAPRCGGPPNVPAIELEDVWFRYAPGEPWVLRGYNLRLAAGEHLELQGPSGTGKTTILRLIAGLYRPERGKVTVLGRDPWRSHDLVTYLPQHTQLLSGSLRDNLLLLSGAGIERVVAACIETRLSEWIAALPMGLETLVAPGGGNLSGGQRQWVVLTAATASDRPGVLLDEATSQMDHVGRECLSASQLFAGRASVRVSHDG